MNLLCEMFIKAGILLATFGMANSIAEKPQNRTKEIVILGYADGRANATAANDTTAHKAKGLRISPENEVDYDESDAGGEESGPVPDSQTSTTQSSKLLFSYVVPANSEKPPKRKEHEEVKEEAREENEEVEEDKEDVQEVEEDKEDVQEEDEDEDEDSSLKIEDEEEYEGEDQHSARAEEEEEYEEDEDRRGKLQMGRRRFDEDHYESEADEEEDHGRAEEEEESKEEEGTPGAITSWRDNHPPLSRERRPHLDFTTIQPYRDPRPVSYSSVVYDPEGNSKTELSGSFYKKPLKVTPSSEVFRNEEENVSEDSKTISVTSAPVGSERSIQAPLHEDEEEEEEDEEEEYIEEPEAVTSNIKYSIEEGRELERKKASTAKPIPASATPKFEKPEERPKTERAWLPEYTEATPRGFAKRMPEDEEEVNLRRYNQKMKERIHEREEDMENYYDTQIAPKRLVHIKPIVPMPRHIFDWTDKETRARGPKGFEGPKDAPQEPPKREPRYQEGRQMAPKRVMVVRPLPPMPRYAFDWAEEEPKREEPTNYQKAEEDAPQEVAKREPEYEEEEEEEEEEEQQQQQVAEPNPKRFNEKTRQQFHDKSNRENYYEQTINTRFGSKEKGVSEEDQNYESEVGDLMKPKAEPEEDWREQSEQRSEGSDEDEREEVTEETIQREVPVKKDRNQLYEYVVHDTPLRQTVKETKAKIVTEAPKKEEVVLTTEATTAKPEKTERPNQDKIHYSKPQRYAFGTITKPQSDNFLTFKNTDNDDVIYNQIVSNIQSLFTPTTQRPSTNYEQHFLPSHGNCQSRPPPEHDSDNYETFIKPSQTHLHTEENEEEEEDDEEEEDENNPMPPSKKAPMKTYVVQKRIHPAVMPRVVRKKEVPFRPRPKPSGVKVTVYPSVMSSRPMYREAVPTSYRNSVYLGPVPSSNKLIKKVIYYGPNEPPKKVIRYSPTNQILRIVRPQVNKRDILRVPPSHRMIIIRKE